MRYSKSIVTVLSQGLLDRLSGMGVRVRFMRVWEQRLYDGRAVVLMNSKLRDADTGGLLFGTSTLLLNSKADVQKLVDSVIAALGYMEREMPRCVE